MNPLRDTMPSSVAWSSWGKTHLVYFQRCKNKSMFWHFPKVGNKSTILYCLKWYSSHRFRNVSIIGYSQMDFWENQGVKSVKKTPESLFLCFFYLQIRAIICEQLTGVLILSFCFLKFNFLTFSMSHLLLLSYTFSIYDPYIFSIYEYYQNGENFTKYQ